MIWRKPQATLISEGQNLMVSTADLPFNRLLPEALEQEQKRVLETEKKLLERLTKSQKARLAEPCITPTFPGDIWFL